MRVIVACECSGRVREAFRRRGHDAWSCDLQPADDGSPFHIVDDALAAIAGGDWDLLVGHPPCTFLCNSSVHLLTCGRPQEANRWQEMKDGARFFRRMWDSKVGKVCLENPTMHGHALKLVGVDYTQAVQPFEFGDPESKNTCLWLRGLPPLLRTAAQEPDLFLPVLEKPKEGRWKNQTPSGNNKLGGKTAAKLRAVTYVGIAEAMADQWGGLT